MKTKKPCEGSKSARSAVIMSMRFWLLLCVLLIRLTLSPQVRAKAAGTGAGLCEGISLSQRRLKRANRCVWICELGTGRRASRRSQIRRHEIQYAFVFSWQNAHVLSAFSLFSVFLSFAGSLFCNFPPPCNSGSPRAAM